MRRLNTLLALSLSLTALPGLAQVSLTAIDTAVTQNFDTLAASGSSVTWNDNATIPGWYSTRATYIASNGSANTGSLYSFGTGTSTERALGGVASGGTATIYWAVRLVNNTGTTITALDISYNGEQWRNGGVASPHTTSFEYQVAAAGVIDGANSPTTGWIGFSALNFTSPVFSTSAGQVDGNGAGRQPLSATLTVSVAPGQEIWLRWVDIDNTGADHGLAIDDLSVTPRGASGTPALSLTAPAPTAEGTAGCSGGLTPFTFTVTATPAPASALNFGWSTSDGSAQDGGPGEDDDYVGSTGSVGTIGAGSSTGSFTVNVRCDAKFENDETFNALLRPAGDVSGTTAGSYTISGTNPVSATITNDDAAPQIALVTPAPLDEGNGGGTTPYAFTVTATGETALAVSVPVSAVGSGANPASNPADFGDPASPLVIPAWSGASTTATVTVPVVADDSFEPDETFTLSFGTPANATIAAGGGSAIGTIRNDDPAPALPTINIGDPQPVTEPDTGTVNVVFPVTIAPAPLGTVQFSVATANGTALAPADYTATSSGTQSFDAGTTSYNFVVPVVGDCVIETPTSEQFFANVTLLSGAAVIGDGQGVATINDNDVAISATLAVSPASAAEGNSGTNTRTVTVTLSQPMQCGDFNFNLVSENGSATAGEDYVALNETGLVLPQNGATTLSRNLVVNGDLRNEPNEDLVVRLDVNSGTNVSTAGTPASIVIQNDDVPALTIPAIQGTGDTSPQSGNTVTTVGNIVTAVVANGFVMQAPAPGDANPGTSDGIFVFTGAAPVYTGTSTAVAVGDLVDLRGRVVEFASTGGGRTLFGTQFTNNSPALTLNRVGSGSLDTLAPAFVLNQTIPSPNAAVPACPALGSSFPAGTELRVQNFECVEYMRITTQTAVTTAPTLFFGTDPVAETPIGLGAARTYREPGVSFAVANEDAAAAQVTPAAPPLPAGYVWDSNPELTEFDPDRLGLPNRSFDPGTRLSATGVIGIDFADYEIWPSAYTVLEEGPALPRAVPAPSADQLTIGSLNLLRLYDLCDDPARPSSGEPSLTPTQIANTNAKLEKLSAYIREVLRAPDVLGVQEAEQPSPAGTVCANAGGTNVPALQLLANRIAADGGPTYTIAHGPVTNDPGFIAVGFLYRADRLTGASFTALRVDEQFSFRYTDGNGALQTRTALLNDRPSLLMQATSTVAGNNVPVAVIVNHLRSLSGIDDLRDTRESGATLADPTFRQDAHRVRQKRLRQAMSLACEIQAFQANPANAGVPLVLVGDFNAFQFSDGYADVNGILRGDTDAARSQYDIGYDGTPAAPCMVSGGQIVQSPFNQGLFALPDSERYSFNFQANAQVLDHALLNAAASARFEGFAYGRGNSDARSNLEFDVTPANRLLRASDHDGFVLRLNVSPTRPTVSGWLLFRDGYE